MVDVVIQTRRKDKTNDGCPQRRGTPPRATIRRGAVLIFRLEGGQPIGRQLPQYLG
jgi:hypothetical protein